MAASDSDDDNFFDDDKERAESVLCKSARLSAANSALLYFSSWVRMHFVVEVHEIARRCCPWLPRLAHDKLQVKAQAAQRLP